MAIRAHQEITGSLRLSADRSSWCATNQVPRRAPSLRAAKVDTEAVQQLVAAAIASQNSHAPPLGIK